MLKLLKKLLVPHEANDYHPHATRHYTLLAYCLAFLLANYIVFPLLGISDRSTLAANIDADELISLTNKDRKAIGLNTLRKNDKLTRAALAKGNDMLKKQYWSHYGPNGETPWQFVTAAGYNYVYSGENLAKDFQTSLDVHMAWMNSKTHKENIVNANFKDIGIAIVSGQFQGYNSTIVVQMFGSEELPQEQPIKPTPTSTQQTATNPNPQQPLPTVSPLAPPTINKPVDGSTFGTKSIAIEGTSSDGNTLKVFSNNRQIGELPNESAAFKINVELLEEKNNIFLRSKDSASGRESGDSNHINVDVDIVPPSVEKVRLQIYRQYKNLYVAVASEEELARVTFTVDGVDGDFIKKGNNFEIKFNRDNIKDPQIKVKFFDIIGNSSESTYNLFDKNLDTNTPPIILRSSSGGNGLNGVIWSVQNMTLTQKINLLFIAVIALIMLFDAIYLLRKGIHRDKGSYHSFNLAIILVTALGILTLFR